MNNDQAKKDALGFIRENVTAVVATSFNDEPRASTVYVYVDDNFNFYFITKRNTSKYINIEMNQKAAIVVGFGPEHVTVQAHGKAEIIVDDAERERIVKELMDIRAREHVKIWPIEELEKFKDRNKIIFKLTPEQVLFLNMDSTKYTGSIAEDYVEVFSA